MIIKKIFRIYLGCFVIKLRITKTTDSLSVLHNKNIHNDKGKQLWCISGILPDDISAENILANKLRITDSLELTL